MFVWIGIWILNFIVRNFDNCLKVASQIKIKLNFGSFSLSTPSSNHVCLLFELYVSKLVSTAFHQQVLHFSSQLHPKLYDIASICATDFYVIFSQSIFSLNHNYCCLTQLWFKTLLSSPTMSLTLLFNHISLARLVPMRLT